MNKANLLNDEIVRSVSRLAGDDSKWLRVLEAAATVASRVDEHRGEFAGSWVVHELASQGGPRWVPNLRKLVSYGLLEKSGVSTRGGRRAYYRMPDRLAVLEALRAWHSEHGADAQRELHLIGAGSSGQEPSDLGRRAGEIAYEPRSWR